MGVILIFGNTSPSIQIPNFPTISGSNTYFGNTSPSIQIPNFPGIKFNYVKINKKNIIGVVDKKSAINICENSDSCSSIIYSDLNHQSDFKEIISNYQGGLKGYIGKITDINNDETFNIDYNDGDTENNVPIDRIYINTNIKKLQKDDEVYSKYKMSNSYFKGKLIEKNNDNTWKISYKETLVFHSTNYYKWWNARSRNDNVTSTSNEGLKIYYDGFVDNVPINSIYSKIFVDDMDDFLLSNDIDGMYTFNKKCIPGYKLKY